MCYPPQLLYSLGNGETASTSFLPPESGLFVHPFGPRKQWNDSYQELTFVSFPDSRGVLASLGPLHDFVPHALDDPDGPAKSHADFYEVEGHVIGREVALDFPFIQVSWFGLFPCGKLTSDDRYLGRFWWTHVFKMFRAFFFQNFFLGYNQYHYNSYVRMVEHGLSSNGKRPFTNSQIQF